MFANIASSQLSTIVAIRFLAIDRPKVYEIMTRGGIDQRIPRFSTATTDDPRAKDDSDVRYRKVAS